METLIIKPGIEKIMRLFYESKREIHLRDIARKTKLNENSVTRFLRVLEKEKFLLSKKDGNLKKYNINRSKQVFSLFSLFDIWRFEKLPSLRKKSIEIFIDKLNSVPVFAVLFGSSAKENFNKKSDIDLLIVVNGKIKTDKAEFETEAQTDLKIQCFQMDYNDFLLELKMKKEPVLQSAIKTGYPLINHIRYYEVIYYE